MGALNYSHYQDRCIGGPCGVETVEHSTADSRADSRALALRQLDTDAVMKQALGQLTDPKQALLLLVSLDSLSHSLDQCEPGSTPIGYSKPKARIVLQGFLPDSYYGPARETYEATVSFPVYTETPRRAYLHGKYLFDDELALADESELQAASFLDRALETIHAADGANRSYCENHR